MTDELTTGEPKLSGRALSLLRERFSLPRLEGASTTLRTLLINALFLLMFIVVLPVFISQFQRDEVIIEPIAVPDAMVAQGLTAEVAASRLWDGLLDVTKAANTSKASIAALPDSRRVEFSFPDSGFSIESLVFHVRRLFNAYDTRIAGEFTCEVAVCDRQNLRLRLRVIRSGVEVIDLPSMESTSEREYFAQAGAGVLSILDPFVAIAAMADREPMKATILAKRLLRSHHPDSQWAYNLVGNIRSRNGDLEGAIEEYRAALKIDPYFLTARGNLAETLRQMGNIGDSQKEFTKLLKQDPKSVAARQGLAEIAISAGDASEAIRQLLEAADLDPLSPHHLARAGQIEIEAGRTADGERLLAQALEIDPGYLPAFASLAASQVIRGDYVAAERIYRDAADYAPDDAEALSAHGRILTILRKCDQAIPRFDRAITLDPGISGYRLQLAQCEQILGNHPRAIKLLEEATKTWASAGDLFMALGDSYRETNQGERAISAYRRFLELDNESPMRAVAQRHIELLSETPISKTGTAAR